MSIFGNIMSKVFGHAGAGEGSLSGATAVGASAPPVQPSTTSAPGAGATGTAPVQSRAQNVDVAAVLDGLASKRKERLDWKHSIVDTMKYLTWIQAFRLERNSPTNCTTLAIQMTRRP